MKDLRIYISPEVTGVKSRNPVFYSRRSTGPYYRWSYEEARNQWRVLRMHSGEFSSKELCSSTWNTLPSLLQFRLKAHYDE